MSIAAAQPPVTASGRRTRVAIVDDSVVVRGLFSRWLAEAQDIEIVGVLRNGLEAVHQVADLRPDILLLDLEMPDMDGLTALPHILRASPQTKVLIVSALSIRGADITLRCLLRGATDYLTKPTTRREFSTSMEFRAALLEKVRVLANSSPPDLDLDKDSVVLARVRSLAPIAPSPLRVVDTLPGRQPVRNVAPYTSVRPANNPVLRPASHLKPQVLLLGASTGGPLAVATFLTELGSAIEDVPVILAQHMPPAFTMLFADHLRRHTGRKAIEVAGGERLERGRIHIARGGQHLGLRRDGAALIATAETAPANVRWAPSVDILFSSAARELGPHALGIILTGMGHDGAAGALAIGEAGGTIMVQDERSSVVWGMPGAALRAGACSLVSTVPDLAQNAARLIRGDER